MTKEQELAILILQNEYRCVDRDCDIECSCGKCDLAMPSKEPILKAYKIAIQAIEDLDKMNGIALDLASENDDLIEKLDAIRAEIEEQVLESLSDGGDDWFTAEKVNDCLEIIDKYRGKSKDADTN